MLHVNDCGYVESERVHHILESFPNLREVDFTTTEKEVAEFSGLIPREIKAYRSSLDDELEVLSDQVPTTGEASATNKEETTGAAASPPQWGHTATL